MSSGRRSYSEETKAEAVDKFRRFGPNEAQRQTGISKSTLIKWAREAGVDPPKASQELAEVKRHASIRAAQERTAKVNALIDARLDRLLDLSGMALTREMQAIAGMEKPTGEDLRALTSSRTTAVRDIETLLKRTGADGGATDNSEMLEMVKTAFVQAMMDADLEDSQMEAVRLAFAHRIRLLASGEAPTYGPGATEVGEPEDPSAESAA